MFVISVVVVALIIGIVGIAIVIISSSSAAAAAILIISIWTGSILRIGTGTGSIALDWCKYTA